MNRMIVRTCSQKGEFGNEPDELIRSLKGRTDE
jgi:hypothetical protein